MTQEQEQNGVDRFVLMLLIGTAIIVTIAGGIVIYSMVSNEARQIEHNLSAVNPTYQQLQEFMATDTVHLNIASDTYQCVQYSHDYLKEASRAGYRGVLVHLFFYNMSDGHELVAFYTTDRGLCFIEPQGNCFVEVELNQSYVLVTNQINSVIIFD